MRPSGGTNVRFAFTLIETIIVVVILAILAAVVISRISVSTEDAKRTALIQNLAVLRSQIELYKLNHNGNVPTLKNNSLPQLISATDAGGNIGPAGTSFPFGPYISGGVFPVNPFDQQNIVNSTAVFPPPAATTAGGWLYYQPIGQIAANTINHLND